MLIWRCTELDLAEASILQLRWYPVGSFTMPVFNSRHHHCAIGAAPSAKFRYATNPRCLS